MKAYIVYPTEDQEKSGMAFFEALDVTFEKSWYTQKLPEYVIKWIEEGQADLDAGRTIALEEFKKKLLIFK